MAGKKVTVVFVRNRQVKDENGDVVEEFEQGKEYDLSPESANHWTVRGVAELKEDYVAAAKSEEKAPEKKPETGSQEKQPVKGSENDADSKSAADNAGAKSTTGSRRNR